MTSIEWLVKELYTEMNMSGDGRVLDEILEEAKEMHKQEMAETFKQSRQALIFEKDMPPVYENFEQYYQETFVSKGSDNSSNISDIELPQQEISDEEIEKAVKNPMHDAYCFREGAKWYREQLKSKTKDTI